MRARSLRWRIILPLLVILFLSGLILSQVLPNLILEDQIDLYQAQAANHAAVFSQLASADWGTTNFNALAREWSAVTDSEILILNRSGVVIGSSSAQPPELLLYRPEFQQAIASGSGMSLDPAQGGQPPIAYSAHQIVVEDQLAGFVHVTRHLTEYVNLQARFRGIIWLSILLIAIAAAVPLLITTSVSGRRLTQISQAANQIAAGNLDTQIPVGVRDEIGTVAASVNQLAQKFSEQFQDLGFEQAKINAVLMQMNEGVMILDDEGQIGLVNQAALNLFNIPDPNILEKTLIRVIRHHQIIDLWQEYLESRQEQVSLVEVADINKLIQVSITPLDESMQGYSLIVFQDLTQLRQLQTIRRDFISNISHELRTPLASLKALAETLQISALEDPKAAKRFLARMEIEIEALAQMVGELLELSRIESGQVPLEMTEVDANQILAGAVERLNVQAERAKLDLKTTPAEEPAYILADPPRLEQVLVNIIHNAIKFTPEGGQITCRINTAPDSITFEISDTGRGIPREDLPRIFERFYKSKRPKQGSGTGLGLSIAKHLVEAHGGQIWAESLLGEGSTFFISLPRQN